jgi:hypothetical protein
MEDIIQARDDQIRILQFSLDQRVRTALDSSSSDPSVMLHGPAVLEYTSDLHRAGSSGMSTGFVTDAATTTDTVSDLDSEVGTERDFTELDTDFASELGSYSEVSAPSSPHFIGSFTGGSPPTSSAGNSSADEWSDLEVDPLEDLPITAPHTSALSVTTSESNSLETRPSSAIVAGDTEATSPGHEDQAESTSNVNPTDSLPSLGNVAGNF